MRVSTVSARVKATKEVNGCWKTIEFAAEGTLDSGDDWKASQDQLFADLTGQLKKAFQPNGPKAPEKAAPHPQEQQDGEGTEQERKRQARDQDVPDPRRPNEALY